MQAQTIDEVIEALDLIIADAKHAKSPKGYFPALYRKVTLRVKEGIAQGEFEDGARMERLDVLFANRYLKAYHQYYGSITPTQSWNIAFFKAGRYWPVVLQHLLFGINAHINLDLGIAAVETVEELEQPLDSLKEDFDKINEILASLVGEVQDELARIFPLLKVLLKLSGKVDDFFVNFSMKLARDGAWKFAGELAEADSASRPAMIQERDHKIRNIATLIQPPLIVPALVFGMVRLMEKRNVARKIGILE